MHLSSSLVVPLTAGFINDPEYSTFAEPSDQFGERNYRIFWKRSSLAASSSSSKGLVNLDVINLYSLPIESAAVLSGKR
jgi:hypothetical protein